MVVWESGNAKIFAISSEPYFLAQPLWGWHREDLTNHLLFFAVLSSETDTGPRFNPGLFAPIQPNPTSGSSQNSVTFSVTADCWPGLKTYFIYFCRMSTHSSYVIRVAYSLSFFTLMLWEPYPSHHHGLFSTLLVLRDFAAREAIILNWWLLHKEFQYQCFNGHWINQAQNHFKHSQTDLFVDGTQTGTTTKGLSEAVMVRCDITQSRTETSPPDVIYCYTLDIHFLLSDLISIKATLMNFITKRGNNFLTWIFHHSPLFNLLKIHH